MYLISRIEVDLIKHRSPKLQYKQLQFWSQLEVDLRIPNRTKISSGCIEWSFLSERSQRHSHQPRPTEGPLPQNVGTAYTQ